MSSRQEQKERRRKEREERERAERAAAQRKKLGGVVGGVAIVAAVVVGIVLAASGGGGGDGGTGGADGDAPAGLPIPPQRQPDLRRAVAAAGCAFREFDNEGQEHSEEPKTPADYKTNPPTSGEHNPVPAGDGFYPAGQSPPIADWVHTLEHGRILIQYSPRVPQRFQRQLRTLFNEDYAGNPGRYHMVLMQNNTNMEYQLAAVAWTRFVACRQVNQRTFDALRAFRDQFVDQAPEQVP